MLHMLTSWILKRCSKALKYKLMEYLCLFISQDFKYIQTWRKWESGRKIFKKEYHWIFLKYPLSQYMFIQIYIYLCTCINISRIKIVINITYQSKETHATKLIYNACYMNL